MKTYSVNISKVNNGFTVRLSQSEKNEAGKRTWNEENFVFTDWKDVIEYLNNNEPTDTGSQQYFD